MLRRLFGGQQKKQHDEQPKEHYKEQYDYKLEWLKGDYGGRGYVIVRLSDNIKLRWETLAKNSGLQAFNVAGTSFREDDFQDVSFSPGKRLSIVAEPDNPYDRNALAVYNENRTKQAGYVPKNKIKDYSTIMEQGLQVTYLSMWETEKDKKRVGLRVLAVYPGEKMKMP